MATNDVVGTPWWDPQAPDAPHRRLIPLVRTLQRQQATRYQNMRKMIAVYEKGYYATLGRAASIEPLDEYKLHFNVAKNAIDTLHAQVCTPTVAPMLLTEGGTFSQRERARKATKAVDGVFSENDFDEVQEDVTLDAQLAYCGFAKVSSEVLEDYARGGTERETGDDEADDDERGESYRGVLRIERVPPEDIFVDEAEGRYRAPRCIYHRQLVDRHVLLAQYGEVEEGLYGSAKERRAAIKKVKPGATSPEEYPEQTDMVEVWEAWHLPSAPVRRGKDGKPKTDGRHSICIENATLFDEPWTRERFPLAVYRPEKARRGFWGLAAMQQAMSGQKEYERVTEKVQRANRLIGGMHFVANRSAKVNIRDITNGVGKIIEIEGDINNALKEWTPQAVSPDTYQYRESVASDVLRYLGISAYSAQSSVPAGLQQASGKALEAFEDQENKRLILRHRARERFVIECSELIIEEALSLIDKGVKVISRHRGKKGFEAVDWADIVDVLRDRDAYVVKTFPVSMLMQNPAAKFAQLDALLERGAITVEQFKRLYDLPDIEAETDLDCADYEVIDKNVDWMVTTGNYVMPQPFDNLDLIKTRVAKAINAYRIAEVPDDRLERLRRYIADAQALQDEANAKANAAGPMMGGAPLPGAMATSEPAAMTPAVQAPMGPPGPAGPMAA